MARDLGVPHTEKQPYYFISYNSEDEKRVSAYAKVLAAHKVPMWYDNGIEIGSKFEMKIAEKIEYCEAVIMFLSKNIFLKEESYVHKEFELATEYSKKRVYVVMLDEIKPPEVPLQFRGWWTDITPLQCVNAYEYKAAESCVEQLIERASLVQIGAQPPASEVTAQRKIKRIEYKNGDVYEGDYVDDKRHGKGKHTFANGDVYEGDFVDDKRTGKGKYTWASGDVYEGDFVDGKRTGKGKHTFANGDVYEGDYVDDKRHGKGKYIWGEGTEWAGDVYEGDFVSGKGNGMGKRVYANGDVYEGAVRDGLPHGKGKIAYANGDVYEGDFSTGVAEGMGRYAYANGDVYEGAVSSGFRCGYGKMLYANGDVYEGNFLLGRRSGVGKMTYASGRVEEGAFLFGVYVGK